MGEATLFRCPRCGAETVVRPRYGDEVVAVYCLCEGPADLRERGGNPVRMEAVSAQREVLAT